MGNGIFDDYKQANKRWITTKLNGHSYVFLKSYLIVYIMYMFLRAVK